MAETYHVLAPAKVNLRLKVVGRRDDGFHLLSMLNAPIDLFDEITLQFVEGREIKVSGVVFGPLIGSVGDGLKSELCSSDNLMVKSAELSSKILGIAPGLEIFLKKNIPIGSGLGGGTSDAAAVVRFLFEKFGGNLESEISRFADIGSDIPFSLIGTPAIVRGCGEKVFPLPETVRRAFHGRGLILVSSDLHVSSVDVYRRFRALRPSISNQHDLVLDAILEGGKNIGWEEIVSVLENDLEAALPPGTENLEAALTFIRGAGEKAVMTGSGSAICIFPKDSDLPSVIERLRGGLRSFQGNLRLSIAHFL